MSELIPSPQHGFDIEDIASDFVEQEVGRHDWRNNWLKMRKEQNMIEHAKAWLSRYGLSEISPAELVTWIDDFVKHRRGWWS